MQCLNRKWEEYNAMAPGTPRLSQQPQPMKANEVRAPETPALSDQSRLREIRGETLKMLNFVNITGASGTGMSNFSLLKGFMLEPL